MDEDDPFDLFIAATNIRFCYYKETHKILGNTYGMCILQDFEAITPNLLGELVRNTMQDCEAKYVPLPQLKQLFHNFSESMT